MVQQKIEDRVLKRQLKYSERIQEKKEQERHAVLEEKQKAVQALQMRDIMVARGRIRQQRQPGRLDPLEMPDSFFQNFKKAGITAPARSPPRRVKSPNPKRQRAMKGLGTPVRRVYMKPLLPVGSTATKTKNVVGDFGTEYGNTNKLMLPTLAKKPPGMIGRVEEFQARAYIRAEQKLWKQQQALCVLQGSFRCYIARQVRTCLVFGCCGSTVNLHCCWVW
jgi:hypothetical protein